MSKTIDERVVSMQFDNGHFEKNVQTSMSTLDKLKNALKFEGAAKGLENVSAAASKCDFSPLAKGVEVVRTKFSALEVMAVTALANITNSAVNAGKRIIAALTIDPVKSGFQEYETQINAVQTILANTSSKGTTLDQVNEALDELNHYADKTIYNFTEMTRNIGTFTAAGIDLDTSVNAIQGIANLAAVSGSTSQQASTAMYQLSQALAAGTVKLMDWNSVVNAGMGGEMFQNALKKTSELLGTGAEAAIEANGSFRESLKSGWLTSQVLTETLKKFTTSGANEYVAEYTGLTKDAVQAALDAAKAQHGEANAVKEASKALAEKSGKNAQEIEDMLMFAQNAEDAATKVKTFSQLIDTLKEAVQSGWTQTWETIIGDFEEAKKLFTQLSDFLGGIIQKSADARNALVTKVFGSKWDTFSKKINDAGVKTEDFQEALKATAKEHDMDIDQMIADQGSFVDVIKSGNIPSELFVETLRKMAGTQSDTGETTEDLTDKLEYFQKVVDEVWKGDYGNSDTGRFEKLAEAGYDYVKVQELVNKTVDGHRLTLEDLSDTQLKSIGYTDEQIVKIRELADQAEKTGTPLNELINDLSKPSGRELLIDSVKNALEGFVAALGAVKKAWTDTFYPDMSEDAILEKRADRIYKIIEAINKFSKYLNINEETAGKITRTFKGLFAALDIVRIVVTGILNPAFLVFKEILKALNLDILDVTAGVGDAIVAFRDWIKENDYVSKGIQKLIEVVKKAYIAVKDWIDKVLEIPVVKNTLANISKWFSDTFETIKNFFTDGTSFNEFISNIQAAFSDSGFGKYITGGIEKFKEFIERIKQLDSISFSNIGAIFKDFRDNVVGYFLDIDFSFSGLKNGITELKDSIVEKLGLAGEKFDWIKDKASEFIEFVRSKIPAAISIGMGVLTIKSITKIADAFELLVAPLGGIGDLLSALSEGLTRVGKSLSGYLKAKKFEAVTVGIRNLAISILIIAGAIALLTLLNPAKMWSAVGAIAAIAVALAILSLAVSKIDLKDIGKLVGIGTMIMQFGIAMLMMVAVMKIAGNMRGDELFKGIAVLIIFGGLITGLVAITKLASEATIAKVGGMMLSITTALTLMVLTMKMIAGMSGEDILKSLSVLTGLEIFILGLVAMSKLAGANADKAGLLALSVGAALILMVGAMKIAAGMSQEDILKGLIVVSALELLIEKLVLISLFSGEHAAKAGAMAIGIGVALYLMVGAMKKAASMTYSDIAKGLLTVAGLELLMAALIRVSKKSGENAAKAGVMLLLMSGALLIMVGCIHLLKDIEGADLAKSVGALSALMIVFGIVIAASKLATEAKGTLIVLTVAIGILAGALYLLTTFTDPEKLDNAANALVKVGGMFTLLSLALGIISKSGAGFKDAAVALLTFVGVAASLYILVGVLSAMQNVQNATENAKALSILAGTLALCLIPLALVGVLIGMTGGASGLGLAVAIAGLAAIMGSMFIVVGVLAAMQGIQNATENLEMLTGMMNTLTNMLVILAIVGPFALIGVIAMASLLGLMVAIGALAVGIGWLMENADGFEDFLNKGIPILNRLAFAVGAMIGNFIAGFSEAIMQILPAFGQCLTDFMTNVNGFIEGARGIKEDVIQGAGYLAGAILALSVADFIAGITTLGGAGLVALGLELSAFMLGAKYFLDEVAKIKPETVSSVESLASAIFVLTKADFLDGINNILSVFTGESSMSAFGESLASFGDGVVKFSDSISELSDEDLAKVDIAAQAGERMAKMANSIPKKDGIFQKILGQSDMEAFGNSLVSFGECIVNYGKKVTEITDEDAAAIERSADAGNKLAELNNAIPKKDGIFQKILGEQDMATFGASLVAFGKYLVQYAEEISGITKDSSDAIGRSVDAGKALADLNGAIPEQDGWAQNIMGEKDLANFGASLVAFGEGLRLYLESVKGIDDDSIGHITKSSEAFDAIKEVIDKVPATGGWLESIAGGKDGKTFGETISSIGVGIKTYITSVKGINDDTVTLINKSKAALEAIVEVSEVLPKDEKGNTFSSGFMTSIFDVVGNIVNYIRQAALIPDDGTTIIGKSKAAAISISEVSSELSKFSNPSIRDTATNITTLTGVISNLASTNYGGVNEFKTALSDLATTDVGSFVNAFVEAGPRVAEAINGMFSSMVEVIRSKATIVKQSFSHLIDDMITAMSEKASKFKTIGSDLVTKLTSGITENSTKAETAARTMVQNAATMADKNSGSFYDVGSAIVDGFVSGISESTWKAEAEATAMAEAALESAREALKVNSPSLVFKNLGTSVPEGFSDGIRKLGSSIKSSTSYMVGTAIDSTTLALSKLNNVDTNLAPTIRPVIDMNSVNSRGLDLSSSISISVAKPISSMSQAVIEAQNEIDASNQKVVSAIDGLRNDLNNLYEEDDREISLYVDSKKLASSIARPMDRQLNILSKRGAY